MPRIMSDAVEAGAIVTEVNGVAALFELVPPGIGSFDGHAQRFGNAVLLPGTAPEIGDGMFEGQSDFRFAVSVRVEIDDADLLLEAAAPLHEKNGIAESQLGL